MLSSRIRGLAAVRASEPPVRDARPAASSGVFVASLALCRVWRRVGSPIQCCRGGPTRRGTASGCRPRSLPARRAGVSRSTRSRWRGGCCGCGGGSGRRRAVRSTRCGRRTCAGSGGVGVWRVACRTPRTRPRCAPQRRHGPARASRSRLHWRVVQHPDDRGGETVDRHVLEHAAPVASAQSSAVGYSSRST